MKKPLVIEDAYKTFTLDQDKIMSPDETVTRFHQRLAAMELQVLEKTKRIDNGRLDIPVYFSICGPDAARLTGTKKQMGKGATPSQAEASAVMELAERFSFFSFCNTEDNFFTDTYANVEKEAIPFEMIAQSVHDESDDVDAARKVFETLPLKWTWGFNLTQNRPALIPFNWFFTINEFNGPSAGNCREEALLQGLCEIVERHVSSLVSHQRLDVPAIRPESATDKMVVEMLKKYKDAGIRLYLSDFTLDMGIPTVGVMAYDPSTFPALSEIVWTAGTTPDPEKALSRALTETAQLAGDFNTAANYVASGLPKYTDLTQADFIMNPRSFRDISDLPSAAHDNLRVEIENCLAALAKKNMDVLVLDTMHAQLQIPAFYTIIPGAHFRERALGTSVGMFTAKIIAETFSPAEAVTALFSMEKTLPGKYYTQFYLGNSLVNMGLPEKALPHFEQSLALEPNDQDLPSIYSYMGVCLKDMEQYDAALDVLSKGEQLDPERTDIYNLMGFCYFKQKKHEEAIACFEKVLALDPSSAIDYANIASNYRDMGKTDKAIHYYKVALELDPSIQFARDNLSKLEA